MHRNKSVDVHQFAMSPRADIPRSSFRIQTSHKTTFNSGYLIPIYCEEILPGDSYSLQMTAFTRMATPLWPVMDNIHLDTFFFFVPSRLVWDNFRKFMGEQLNPGDSTSYTVPVVTSAPGGFTDGLYDYFGIPGLGQIDPAGTLSVNALPLRAYNLIYNEWFRDENLESWAGPTSFRGDGPDLAASYTLRSRGKRHDYFTSCLPFVQKGTAVSVPLGSTAPVITTATEHTTSGLPVMKVRTTAGATVGTNKTLGISDTTAGNVGYDTVAGYSNEGLWSPTNLYADLSAATAATINQLRQSFQIQKLLERDARGGTRYTELVRAHFGVVSPDARLQRPEYLGGTSTPIQISPIAQTATSATPGRYVGGLAAMAQGVSRSGFSQAFTEHGYVIGIVSVRADLSYQQGLRKLWSRSTRYDFYFPVFAALGEQAVLQREIYATGLAADTTVFGYQERWAEYRYHPALITGQFKSYVPTPLDSWHLSQYFLAAPTLGGTFIRETPPISRVIAQGSVGPEFLFDSFFDIRAARPMPLYSVPGMIDHF